MMLNFVNVFAVLWSAQAGRALAFYIMDALGSQAVLAVAVTLLLRLVVLSVFAGVVVIFGYALSTMYLASPLFLCEFYSPSFGPVSIKGLPEVSVRLRFAVARQSPLTGVLLVRLPGAFQDVASLR